MAKTKGKADTASVPYRPIFLARLKKDRELQLEVLRAVLGKKDSKELFILVLRDVLEVRGSLVADITKLLTDHLTALEDAKLARLARASIEEGFLRPEESERRLSEWMKLSKKSTRKKLSSRRSKP